MTDKFEVAAAAIDAGLVRSEDACCIAARVLNELDVVGFRVVKQRAVDATISRGGEHDESIEFEPIEPGPSHYPKLWVDVD